MFSVSVRDHVMIAHSLRGEVFGPAQRMHGATYVVEIELRRPRLDPDGIVTDIGRASALLASTLEPRARGGPTLASKRGRGTSWRARSAYRGWSKLRMKRIFMLATRRNCGSETRRSGCGFRSRYGSTRRRNRSKCDESISWSQVACLARSRRGASRPQPHEAGAKAVPAGPTRPGMAHGRRCRGCSMASCSWGSTRCAASPWPLRWAPT